MNDEIEPIECRAAVGIELPHTVTNEIRFLPTGMHAITPEAGGIGRPIKIKINPETAAAVEQQRAIMAGKGKRPYFDFNHEDGPASFWPETFYWRSGGGGGVIAKGEWTARGRAAVEGKDYRAFSPVFHVDNKRSDPATVICKEHADPNMGGLVNNPTFKDLPLWAKNAGVTALKQQQTNGERKMNDEIAALRAKQKELQQEVASLGIADDDESKTQLTSKQAELRETQLQIEAEELKISNAALEAKVRKHAQEAASAAVKAAVKRGAILPRDLKVQKDWETWATADPSKLEIIAKLQSPHQTLDKAIIGKDIVGGRVAVSDEDPSQVFGAMARILSNSGKTSHFETRRQLSREFAAIYAREMRGSNKERMLAFPVEDFETAIAAADVTDASLATLSGSLVSQRTLELLRFTFPSLTMFTTDFSDQGAQFNQTVITRTVGIPSVTDYSTSTGWAASTATTADVPVTINKHKGVNIVFNEQILASTVRRLFDEFAPAAAYAMALQMVNDLYANITDANFTNNTVVATASFVRTSVISLGVQLTLRGVPLALGSRTLLLWPTVFANLVGDTALITFAAYQKPELITAPQTGASLVIPVDTFQVVNAPNLPTNNANLTGFACSKSALVIATRMPNDYTTAMPGASYGNVQMITEPDIGMSVMLTQFVDHKLAAATFRLSWMYGTAAGQTAAGQLLKSAAGSGSGR